MKAVAEGKVARRELLSLVRNAVKAPSGHNTQPWRFLVSGQQIEIQPDFGRRLPVVDPDDHALYISLGAALENLRISALSAGLQPETEYFGATAPGGLRVDLSRRKPQADDTLYRAIPERQTTRSTYSGQTIPAAELQELEKASAEHGVQFRIFTSRHDFDAITELAKEASQRQMREAAFVRELMGWIRFSHEEAVTHCDGLVAPAMGMPAVPRWLGASIMKAMLRPDPEARRTEKLIRSSAALVLFIAEVNDREHWVRLGQSFERVALAATSRGIRHAHVNMPCEVLELRTQFQHYLGLEDEQPLLLLRMGYGNLMPRSPRRPLATVLGNGSASVRW
jgi:hypothetical protein